MRNREFLRYGLNALSRAHETNYFDDGHRGGAIVSAFYLCRENHVEADVPEIIAKKIEANWAHTDICAPFPDEDSEPQLLNHIVECMSENIAGLRQAGHNVILPSLALKAFRELPEAITPSRVTGVCRLIESFTVTDVPMDADVQLPNMDDKPSTAVFILGEFVKCTERFEGRGQGWSGHLLTYGKALIDLRELGYVGLAKQAEEGFSRYIRRIRMGPQETDKRYREHSPTNLFPLQAAYWKERQGGDWHLGHKLKYPYGFYGLINCVKDAEIKRRCLESAYRIF
jgi:hypothetical protein